MRVDDQHLWKNLAERRSLMNLNYDMCAAAFKRRDILHACLQRCAQTLVDHLGVTFARIWTLNEDEAMLELHASAGIYTHLNGLHSRIPVGKWKIGRIAAERRPYLTNAVSDDPNISDHAWAKREGLVAFAGYPLIADGHLLGVAALFSRHVLTEGTLQVMCLIVNSIALDIERCYAENAMQESDELFRAAFANAGVGMALTDLTGHFLQVNHAYSEITGYSEEELFRTAFLSITHPEDRERKMVYIRAMIAGDIPDFVIEKRYLKKDGSIVWVHNSISLGHDLQGQPLYIIMLTEDITQRKQAEEERNQWLLREQMARAEAERAWHQLYDLFQKAPGVICILRGPRHVYELANPFYQQIVGNYDLIGKSIHDVRPELEKQGIFEILDHVYQTGETYVGYEMPVLYDRHDGKFEDVYLNFVYQALRSTEGAIDGILVYAVDVTKEVLARQRMDTFLGIASHELKTPLTCIKGNVQLAQRHIRRAIQEISPESVSLQQRLTNVQTMLERAEQKADLQNRLVSDLIDITRIQADEFEMRMAQTDLYTVVSNAVEEQRHIVPTRIIQFTCPLDDAIQLYIDADRIGQVITNFLTNAIKYSEDEAPIMVQIEYETTTIRVSVTDQGPGLAESQQQHSLGEILSSSRH